MRRKFKLKVSYTFNGCFTLHAASGKEAARLVSEQCGTVLSAIQTTLGEESEVDWHFDKHPRLAGKHGKIDPVGTDEIDPVKTA